MMPLTTCGSTKQLRYSRFQQAGSVARHRWGVRVWFQDYGLRLGIRILGVGFQGSGFWGLGCMIMGLGLGEATRLRQACGTYAQAHRHPRAPAKGNSHARPVHLIITMIKRIRTRRLSIKNSLSLPHPVVSEVHRRSRVDG